MKHKQLNSRGFSALEILIVTMIIVFIIIIGLVVLIVGKSDNSKAPKASDSTSLSLGGSYGGWETYSNQAAELTFRYPSNWQSQVSDVTPFSNGSFAGISGTLTAPDNKTLYWVYDEIGGKGNASCTPNSTDVPFEKTDTCASKQTFKVEQIPAANPTPNSVGSNLFEDRLYITETKFYQPGKTTDPVSGRQTTQPMYQVCLDPYDSPNSTNGIDTTPLPSVGTVMGSEEPCSWSGTGFNVTFPVANQAGFSSTDAKTAILIMKSFNSIGN